MQLIHMIREENKTNQQKIRNRENILYGRPLVSSVQMVEENTEAEDIPAVSTFKLRFLVAVVLFATYLVLDMGGGSILGKNTKEIHLMMKEDYQSNIFDFIENITYTLNDTAEIDTIEKDTIETNENKTINQ